MPRRGASLEVPLIDSGPVALEVVSDGIVAPLTFLKAGEGGEKGSFDGGAYYANGAVCMRALQKKRGFTNQPRPLVPSAAMPRRQGTHLFAGMLKNEHIGHFLVESLSRLWAARLIANLQSIVFYKRMAHRDVPRWAVELVEIVAPGLPFFIVTEPTTFETLIVPDQVADPSNAFLYGHRVIRDLFAPLRQIEAKPIKKLYISRSKLEAAQGSFLGEREFESILAEEGFTIFHPQEHSLREQAACFNGADTVVLAEGTAVHLLALACRPGQRVYLIQRRSNKDIQIFIAQLRSFGCEPEFGPEEPASHLVPKRHGRSYNGARALIDFEKLRAHLVAAGFVSNRKWLVLSANAIQEEVYRLEQQLGQELVEHTSEALQGWQTDTVLDDLASCKPALTSSVSAWSRYQDPARDAGGANGKSLANDFGFHTGGEENPWWRVDLLSQHRVEVVAIVNRQQNSKRFSAFAIDGSLDGDQWTRQFATNGPTDISSEMDNPWRKEFAEPFSARFVRIMLLGAGPLHLRRVRVFGRQINQDGDGSPGRNIA